MTFPYKNYSNIAKLGPGEMTDVFSATLRSTSHKVVIKKMASDLSVYPGNYKIFDQNVKSLKLLHHSNIIRVHDYGVYENAYYLSMEYIDGFDLEQLLHIPEFDRAVGFMIVFEALKGLMHAHKHGVFHCNIKPGNILISKNGRVKLSDFGIAHVKDHLLHTGNSNAVYATPFYMPPEQAPAIAEQALDIDVWEETATLAYKETLEEHTQTLQSQTRQWDMWSVGVLLYRMCSGNLPFFGKNLAQLANSIATLPQGNLLEQFPTMPVDLAYEIDLCLRKDPLERPASLDQVISSLQLLILTTGVHDNEPAIKKHLRDSILQTSTDKTARNDFSPGGPEKSAGKPLKPARSRPPRQPGALKATVIVVSVLVILLLTVFYVAKKPGDLSNAKHLKIASLPVEPARNMLPAETAAAHGETPVVPVPSETSFQEIDSAMTAITAQKAFPKPEQKEKMNKKPAQIKPKVSSVYASADTSAGALRNQMQDTARPATETTSVRNGTLKVTVEPAGAAVAIDGVPVSGQEIAQGKQFPAGPHTISVSAEGFEPFEQSLQLEADSDTPQSVSVALKQKIVRSGSLLVNSNPWSTIVIDEKTVGTTLTTSPVTLAEGSHTVLLEREGFLPFSETVMIKNGIETRIRANLVKQDSTIGNQ